jgi:hypothetical protein
VLIGAFFLVLSNNLRISAGLKEVRRWSVMSHTLWILIFNSQCTYVELHDWKCQNEDLGNSLASRKFSITKAIKIAREEKQNNWGQQPMP